MFWFYLKLALKNLFRQKRRTILTALAIAVGIFYYILIDSVLLGVDRDSIRNLIDFETGHLQITSAIEDDDLAQALKHLLPDEQQLLKKIGRLKEKKEVTPRLFFPAMLTNGMEELPIIGVGVDPASEVKVFRTSEYLVEGRWLKDREPEIVIGKKLAELLSLQVGDLLTIRTKTKKLTFQAFDLTIVGLAATPDPLVNSGQFFMPLKLAQEYLETGEAISMAVIRLDSQASMAKATKQIQEMFAGQSAYKIKKWQEAAASFLEIGKTKKKFNMILILLVWLISTIGIVNTILLSSLERRKETGILKAMGMTEKEIIHIFVYEAVIIGVMAGAIGVSLGILGNLYMVNIGFDISAMTNKMDMDIGYPIADRFYGVWNWGTILQAFIFGLIATLLASYFPARKAARMDPVEGLRKV